MGNVKVNFENYVIILDMGKEFFRFFNYIFIILDFSV